MSFKRVKEEEFDALEARVKALEKRLTDHLRTVQTVYQIKSKDSLLFATADKLDDLAHRLGYYWAKQPAINMWKSKVGAKEEDV